MASRRSRIKGIANIPQRRKPVVEQEATQEDVRCEESNLSPQQVITNSTGESQKEEKHADGVDLNTAVPVENNKDKPCETDIPTHSNHDISKNVAENVNPNISVAAPQTQPSFNRRRLIKPAISLKAIQKSVTPPSISSPSEEPEITKPQEEPSPPEDANCPSVISKTSENPPINTSKHAHTPVRDDCINKEISVLGITKLPLTQSQNQNLENCTDKNSFDEIVRPSPACSPSKYMNRARIKAIPRLGQRRPSFSIGSASESEDESKKSYKTVRIRNDSVCSSVSTPAPPESPAVVAEVSNPRKKPEFNSVIQRKCRRTEQSRKLAEARRDFQQKFNNGKPDRQKLTMIDLIFYNPGSSPMSQKRKRKDTETESILSAKHEEDIDDAPAPDEPSADATAEPELSDEENTVPAPQITIGANGEIIIDEKSLFIENKDIKRDRELLKKSNLVDGDKFETGYGVFKRVKRSKDWSKDETLRFYKALNTMGTDFTLMCELFPGRSRRELKMKFKKEERVNRALIDRAVMQPIQFDITDLQRDLEKQELEKLRNEQIKKDLKQYREDCKAAREEKKEKEKAKAEEVPAVKKKRKTWTGDVKVVEDQIIKPANAKEALKKKLQQGIHSLLASDDSDDENANVVEDSVNAKEAEINENNNHIDLSDAIEQNIEITSNIDVTSPEMPADTNSEAIEMPEVEKSSGIEETNETEVIEEGSIVVTSLDADGKEIYTAYSVNCHGEKIPLDLNPGVLDVLLKNQKSDKTVPLPENADESLILPSDNTIDNIMADISLSNLHDNPDMSLTTTADCMILSFEDIDANIATNSTANIVAIQTGP
ncbi:transcription factor TFIIIB component B'' homolog [Atheta coriaria]|uniref:transcription factor TFIIIB component B'' homolog n=1 Tax=Dalotia coriaria TaxID=877792 RepID=UPI0031F39762